MAFVQIIEMRTDKFDELQALEQEWKAATEGKRTLLNSVLTRDRNDPNRYFILAYFDSYESAMENSSLPETTEIAERQLKLLDSPPVFYDLDVVDQG